MGVTLSCMKPETCPPSISGLMRLRLTYLPTALKIEHQM